MKILSIRSGLLLGAAAVGLAACDSGGDIESTGVVAPINVTIGGGSGGGGGGGATADGVVDFTSNACPTGTAEGTITSNGIDITACLIDTASPLTNDLTLTAGNAYGFSGTLFVGENQLDAAAGTTVTTGVTLTIEPGVVVFGAAGEDALVVNPGSFIEADGTATQPIIFTSATDLEDADQATTDLTAVAAASDGLVRGSSAASGEWGGIVINGLAPINDCDQADLGTADCTKSGEGGSGSFGGTNPADSSGSMEYVRVQYPGFLFSSDDELNGIALQGVGSGTTLSYIHVHNSKDDAFEWFGGTVSADHLVATGAGDDSFDWTDGWTGSLQFGVIVQNKPESGDPRGFEGDSNGDFPNSSPRSMPNIANVTLVSEGNGDDGMKIRRGSAGIYANIIVSGFGGNGLDFDTGGSETPRFESIYLAGSGSDATDSDAASLFDAGSNNVRGSATLPGIFSIAETRAVLAADLADDDDNDADLPVAGLEEVLYIGAFADSVQSYEDSWLFDWALEIPEFDNVNIADDCPAGTFVSQNTTVPAGRTESNVCTLPNLVEGDLFLPAGNLYELDGTVFVGEDAGAGVDAASTNDDAATGRLTIAQGVTLFGSNGPDALVVTRGSQIIVQGTENAPVVMTSRQDVLGQTVGRGQWGGLVINGRAPINACEYSSMGTVRPAVCEKEGEGGSGFFGGETAADDSGQIEYLRVSYAGFLFGSDDELNGIAFQGVGSGTEVSYIQVHANQDDGIEFFGGTVSVDHAIVTDAGDDAFDWTDGWQGNAQYVILDQLEDGGISGDPRVIEADSNGSFPDRDPRSSAVMANVTVLAAANGEDAMRIRRGTDLDMYNSVVVGQNADEGLDFRADGTAVPDFFSVYIVDFASVANATAVSSGVFPGAAGNNNVDGEAASQDSTLSVATGATVALVPGANENAVTPTTLPAGLDANGSGFIGAVEDAADTWYLGWTVAL
ncbi:hypothetical protein HK107_12365 [Parvularcula sp. ZS-1/3]|uniref:Lipoprotein n=1 Tax=Parvularcula mediterranea TaxID=2732508 RepID=A0A7Y3RN36_9PROT|nr:hypothetical protein [Parvularcula mediterranea]NNU17116.1 hypothetical protein [Parvularcula mediterranea]